MKTASLFLLAIATPIALAQSLQFEVASIKPASQDQLMAAIRAGQRPHTGVTVDKGRAEFGFQSLIALIEFAYSVPASLLTGPEMLKTERFDIIAKLPAGATDEQAPLMMRTLLAERFGLVIHREKKEIPIYALIVGKNGLNPKKMKPATTEEIAPEPMPGDVTQTTPFGKMIRREVPGKGMVAFMPGMGTLKTNAPTAGGQHLEMSNLTTGRFAQLLSSDGDRPVIDKTNLKGSYAASFDISMDAPPPPPPAGGSGGGPMLEAPRVNPMLQAVEQMGLKMEPQREELEIVVVDHIEKTPTEN